MNLSKRKIPIIALNSGILVDALLRETPAACGFPAFFAATDGLKIMGLVSLVSLVVSFFTQNSNGVVATTFHTSS